MKPTLTISNADWRTDKRLSAELMKTALARPQVGRMDEESKAIRPQKVRRILLKRKLGFAGCDLPAEMVITERSGKWFNVSGREITNRAALLACYHHPDAEPEPRYGRIAGHTRAPKPLASNWPKPYQANGGKSNLWRFESRD
jgi:hypothetical protein